MKAYEVFNIESGEAAPIYFAAPEAAINYLVENFGEENVDKFDMREADTKGQMDAEIAQEREKINQEENADDGALTSLAKGAARFAFPYMVEEAETTGDATSGGAVRDLARYGTMFTPAGSVGAMLGMGASALAQDVSAQKEYQGEIDPTRTAVGAVFGVAPAGITAGMKTNAAKSASTKVGEFLKDRGAGQMYNVINPNRNARIGKNAMTTEQVKTHILEKDRIPFFSREETALNNMGESILDDLDVAGRTRDQAARNVDEQVPVFYKKQNEVSHMEAVPSDASIMAEKQLAQNELDAYNQSRQEYPFETYIGKALDEDFDASQAAKAEAKATKEYTDLPVFFGKEEPKPMFTPAHPQIDEWGLQKVVEQPEKITRGAYENARRRILVDNRNTPDIAKKIIESLDSWYESMSPKNGSVNAYKASKMVTDLNKAAKTFEKTQGATSAQEEAKSYMAMAINEQIEKASPELREMSRDMSGLMTLKKPVLERAKANAVKASARSGIRSEVGAFLARGPQSAQLQYNIGKGLTNGSPALQDAISVTLRQGGTSVGQRLSGR